MSKKLIKELLNSLLLNEWSCYTEYAGARPETWCNHCKSSKKDGHDYNCDVKLAIDKATAYLEKGL